MCAVASPGLRTVNITFDWNEWNFCVGILTHAQILQQMKISTLTSPQKRYYLICAINGSFRSIQPNLITLSTVQNGTIHTTHPHQLCDVVQKWQPFLYQHVFMRKQIVHVYIGHVSAFRSLECWPNALLLKILNLINLFGVFFSMCFKFVFSKLQKLLPHKSPLRLTLNELNWPTNELKPCRKFKIYFTRRMVLFSKCRSKTKLMSAPSIIIMKLNKWFLKLCETHQPISFHKNTNQKHASKINLRYLLNISQIIALWS